MSSVSKSLLGAERVDVQDVGWKTMDSSARAMKKHHGDDEVILLEATILTTARLLCDIPSYYNQIAWKRASSCSCCETRSKKMME